MSINLSLCGSAIASCAPRRRRSIRPLASAFERSRSKLDPCGASLVESGTGRLALSRVWRIMVRPHGARLARDALGMFVVLAIDRTIAGLRAAQRGRRWRWQPEREAPVSYAPVL